ncbi:MULTISPECIES: hypothetical protein [Roseomonadaceae]|uniref:Uncharacterized protein n=1 Tax=Falsiroseomonas oleicola TaxID=2801474 RepID=A0ABS6H6H8_9PROT|nr:hypothetical protein [Roseomonas oleicola]MBU8544299.1 hypothetical protein [Roseomonas oleicola]
MSSTGRAGAHRLRRRLQTELAVLRRSLAIPILLVTHDLEEALALADRMVVMHRGRGFRHRAASPGPNLRR